MATYNAKKLTLSKYNALTQENDLFVIDPMQGKEAVAGPASATANAVAIFDGTSGKAIKNSGYTIGKSVPSDAVFTDTTYSSKSASSGGTDVSLCTTGEKYTWNNKAGTSTATQSANGLMSSTDKTKLDNISQSTMREVPIAIGYSDWSGSGTSWTANFVSAYITTTSKEIVTWDNSIRTYAKGDLNVTKTSGGGGLTITSTNQPTGTILGTAYVWDNADGKVPTLIEDTVVSIANGGTGQSTLSGAQSALKIGDPSTLHTTAKTDLVAAVNENADYKANKGPCSYNNIIGWSMLTKTETTYNTYNSRKFSDYDILMVGVLIGGYFRPNMIMYRSQFLQYPVSMTYYSGGEHVEIVINTGSDTSVNMKYNATGTFNISVGIFGITNCA